METYRGVLNITMCALLWLVVAIVTYGFGLLVFGLWLYLVFANAEVRKHKAADRIEHTLMPNERLLQVAVQLRPFALFARRKALGVTESRIILVHRGTLGGFTMQDIQWKDLQDAEISENILPETCGSSLSFSFRKHDYGSVRHKQRGEDLSSGTPALVIAGVPSTEARFIYSNAQAQEQAWEEKRRIRAIEETRAAAGGVYLNTDTHGSQMSGSSGKSSPVEQLNGLKGLLDSGAITDVEFNEMKAKIIARI